MSTIINGTSNAITFPDGSIQNSAGLTAASPVISSGSLTFSDATTVTSGKQVAKSWVYWTVSGTTVTLGSSYNVSSVTRNSAGNYTVNFSNALNSGYAPFVGAGGIAGLYDAYASFPVTLPTTTNCGMLVMQAGTATQNTPLYASFVAFGA